MKTKLNLIAVGMLLAAGTAGLGQPNITTQPADRAVASGTTASFSVVATGTAPLRYQWRREGADLPGATNATYYIVSAQFTNAGGYTVSVTNLAGAVTSRVAQLSVAQVRIHTNAAGAQLTYYLFVPPSYDPSNPYPLVLYYHGGGGVGGSALYDLGQFIFLSATNQVQRPCLFFVPQGQQVTGTCEYYMERIDHAAEVLTLLQAEFNIDSDRLYITGESGGGGMAWDMAGRAAAGRFAAAVPVSPFVGVCTNSLAMFVRSGVALWDFHSADDVAADFRVSDGVVASLRNAGANAVYTRYQSGGHTIYFAAYATPGLVDWVMAQRRGVAVSASPFVSITVPTTNATYVTASSALDIGGTANHPVNVLQVTWTNTANHAAGSATGTQNWSADAIPLQADVTNLIVVTAWSTNSISGTVRGGYTTFNDTLTVIQLPIQATLRWQATGLILSWTGGGPPYRVQRASDLALGDWTDFLTNAVPPVGLPADNATGFYRVVGR